MFFSRSNQEQVADEKKAIRSIFELPLIEHLAGISSEWIHDEANWKMDETSAELFKRARDGQGFSAIVFVETDLTTMQPIAKIVLYPAFNGESGLAKEDKLGAPYTFFEYVESTIGFGQPGVGIVHDRSVQKYALKKELENSKSTLAQEMKLFMEKNNLSDYNEALHKYHNKMMNEINAVSAYMKGHTLGLGIIKGAEYKTAEDFTLQVIDNEKEASLLREHFLKNKTDALANYPKDKKYLIFVPSGKDNNYEVYYILNQKIVRRPTYKTEIQVPLVSISQDMLQNKAQNHEPIATAALKALDLAQPIFINNKSASQNNITVSYDFDFESFIMYAAKEQYILKEQKLFPEGKDDGAFYDLRRSVPLSLMTPFCHALFSELNEIKLESRELERQKSEMWSSFPTLSYLEIIQDFNSASLNEKLLTFGNNIHIALRLYHETLLILFKAFEIVESTPRYSNIKELQKLEHPSFKGTFYINHAGEAYVIESEFTPYFAALQKRLTQVLFSFYRTKSILQNDTNLLDDKSFIPEWIKEMGDTRTLKQVLEDCRLTIQDMPGLFSVRDQLETHLDAAEKNMTNFNLVRQEFHAKALEYAQSLCTCTRKIDITKHFHFMPGSRGSMLDYLRHIFGSKAEIDAEIKNLLQLTDQKTGKTALENVVEQGWYDAAFMLLSYGADPTIQNKKTGKTIFNVLVDKIKAGTAEIDDKFLLHIIAHSNLQQGEVTDLLSDLENRKKGLDLSQSIAFLQDKINTLGTSRTLQ